MRISAGLSTLAAFIVPATVAAVGSSPSSINASSLIPTNVSSGCYTLLLQLDSDSLFQQCTSPLIEATEIYVNATSSNESSSSLTQSLDHLCTEQTGCDRTLVRQYIAQFWDSCTSELESGNDQVAQLYDYLYIFNPFRDAMCTKNSNGTYCLESLGPSMQSSVNLEALQLDAVFDADNANSEEYWAHTVNTVTTSNLASNASDLASDHIFLFLSGTTDKSTICTECARDILAAYVSFEMATPYALGLERSSVLQPQIDIYTNARKQCGSEFLQKISTQAGMQQFPSGATIGR
ncbi:hypothetical protein MYAM1_003649 [Malassezia yamatoensis]|uniref:DUF7729 domain-containing protein n=1 Tax=Malassezia yamatoensis TaxID=253288 RepID=A0AAJ5YUI9_9BASI|nr:hypothetical protein MYAM1_003649 [Malassezia yamatoensis]